MATFSSFYPRHRTAGLLLTMVLGLTVSMSPLLMAQQEYLANEQPVATTVDGQQSAFDSLSESQEPPEPGVLIPGTFGLFEATDEWFQGASLYIKPRFYYRHRDEGNGQIRETFAGGGSIEAESGWILNTFNLGASMFTSQRIFGAMEDDGTGLLQDGQGGYTALGHAYLQVRYRSTVGHFFRQEIDIPFLNRDDARMTPKAFEAYLIKSENPFGIEGLRYGAGHVTRVKDLTSSDFVSMSELAGVDGKDRGVSVVGARYEVTEYGLIGITDQYGWDMFNTFYGQGELRFEIPGTGIVSKGSVQFTDQRSVGEELLGAFDTQMYGAVLSMELRGFLATLGWTTTSDEAAIQSPWGGDPAFNSVMIDDFDRAGENSYRAGLSYDFTELGLPGVSAFANYVYGNTPDSGRAASPDQTEWNLTVDYRPPVELLENLWVRLRSGVNDMDGDRTREEFRVIVNYSIPF